jgi:hypothetical protein
MRANCGHDRLSDIAWICASAMERKGDDLAEQVVPAIAYLSWDATGVGDEIALERQLPL